ncbi:type III secretion system outer membrane ring subunit SctC [Pseudomonas sp. D1HM]|uniref:type III secretion system outer membrane ring subunit SctC n=1 Tax=Pseudomonas sp. D1HM TaxID=1784816 RepID=UPI002119B813|nr:type III secretion system outer membrane ring subunit SctC [Pseudomonas sp. D1HM]
MPMTRFKFSWHIIALLLALLLIPQVMAAAPEDWKKTPYAHEATHRAVGDFLHDFAHTVGLQLQIDGLLEGTVNGKIRAETLLDLLDRLALEHRFQWFVYSNTLYISSINEQTSTRLEVADDAIADLKQALLNIGLLDERFGWGELPDIGVVLVSGPKRYIEHIKQFSRKRTEPIDQQSVLTFPLQFANAADRHIDYRGTTLTVPGIANLLRGLLAPPSSKSSGSEPAPQPLNSPRSNTLPTALTDLGPVLGAFAPAGGNRVRVEADVRNNSVLIYDSPQRHALYQTLIAKLDVARNLVEIDAIILDIDRTQLKELGMKWGLNSSRFQADINNLTSGTSSRLFIRNLDRFTADIRALEDRGLATMVSNPSIMTLENQPAVIDFNRTQYIQAVGDGVANILPVTAGTSLQAIPRVITTNGANQVHLIIDIEDGNFATADNASTATPDVRKGKISTQAVIAEKQSLVIGGFHVAEGVSRLNKVPLLGDIPFLGKLLFSSSNRAENRRERLFILTPRLVGDQINPSRYLPPADQASLEHALMPLARRHAQSPVIKRNDVASALAHLVTGQVPKHFTAMPIPIPTGTLCKVPDSLSIDPVTSQWYEGQHFSVAVLVLHNQSKDRVRIDESECNSEQTLAVSVWPRAWLAPGEKAEVFIASRPRENHEPVGAPRPSLLEPARSITP